MNQQEITMTLRHPLPKGTSVKRGETVQMRIGDAWQDFRVFYISKDRLTVRVIAK